MDKQTVSGIAILLVMFVAWVVVRERRRTQAANATLDKDADLPSLPAQISPDVTGQIRTEATQEPAPLALGQSLTTQVLSKPQVPALTAREKRENEIREKEKEGLCIYCHRHATHGIPTPEFVRFDLLAILTGDDLGRHWRVRARHREWSGLFSRYDVDAILCADHYKVARVKVNRFIATLHASHTTFIAEQTDDAGEFARHGVIEILDEEARRVRGKQARAGSV